MLILDRNKHESLYIGEDIFIKVIEIQGTRVTLGIEAPKNVSVLRKELLPRNPRHPAYKPDTKSCREKAAEHPGRGTLANAPLATFKPATTNVKVIYKRRKRLLKER